MATAGTVAVLLPGAFYFLRETKLPPIAALRAARRADRDRHRLQPRHRRRSRRSCSTLNMACTLFRLTPEEALAGVTRTPRARSALADTLGTLEVGKAADLAAWEIDAPAELAYAMGAAPLYAVWTAGVRRT